MDGGETARCSGCALKFDLTEFSSVWTRTHALFAVSDNEHMAVWSCLIVLFAPQKCHNSWHHIFCHLNFIEWIYSKRFHTHTHVYWQEFVHAHWNKNYTLHMVLDWLECHWWIARFFPSPTIFSTTCGYKNGLWWPLISVNYSTQWTILTVIKQGCH